MEGLLYCFIGFIVAFGIYEMLKDNPENRHKRD